MHIGPEPDPEHQAPFPSNETPQDESQSSKISPATWIALGILVLTFAAYLQVMGFYFIRVDDPLYVTNNPSIQSGLNLKSIRYAFTTGDDGSYLPLVWLSHAACVSLFGDWAGGHHLVNLLFHAASSVLLFYFLKRLTKSMWPSAAVAILFALHPLHVESVAWVAERKDVLSTFFWILTSWAYVRYVEQPSKRRYLVMTVLFVLGLLSKSMLVTLPLTLLLFDVWPLRRLDRAGGSFTAHVKAFWPLVAEKLPLFALSLGAAAATLFTQSNVGAVAHLPLNYRVGNALISTTKYIEQTLWPFELSAFYPFRWTAFPLWKVAGSLAFILILSGACILNRRRRPYLAVGWFWYLITLLPVIGIIQVGSQAHADRYTYVPLIGIFIMLAWLGEELAVRWRFPRMLLLATSGALLGVLLTLTVAQVVVWRDNLTLFKNAIILDAENPLAIMNIGDEYFKRDQFQDAYTVYLKGVSLAPGMHISHFKIGQALEMLGRDAEAVPYYRNAKRLKPDMLTADQQLGRVLTRLGRFEEAAPFVQRVIEQGDLKQGLFDPVDIEASHIDWAIILASRNQLPGAIQVFESLLAMSANSPGLQLRVGQAYLRMGRPKEALPLVKRALERSPKDPEVFYSLGVVFTQLNQFPEAQHSLDQLKKVAPESPLFQRGISELQQAQAVAGRSVHREKVQVRPS